MVQNHCKMYTVSQYVSTPTVQFRINFPTLITEFTGSFNSPSGWVISNRSLRAKTLRQNLAGNGEIIQTFLLRFGFAIWKKRLPKPAMWLGFQFSFGFFHLRIHFPKRRYSPRTSRRNNTIETWMDIFSVVHGR